MSELALRNPFFKTANISLINSTSFFEPNQNKINKNFINFGGEKITLVSQEIPATLEEDYEKLKFNYKKLSPIDIENIFNSLKNERIIFNKVIDEINKSPEGKLLDMLGFLISSFDKKVYYDNVIIYISNQDDNLSESAKMFLIEIIERWDSIPADDRIKDLNRIKSKYNKDYIKNFIDSIIRDIRENE